MEDMDGDQASGIITFPIRYGRDAGKTLYIYFSRYTHFFVGLAIYDQYLNGIKK
ncbi:MAG: hypothetical protein IPJ13_02490 [Saprospiraceae bacterium]|nr:hypothetical protein [Saprospiraceae bacterium]